MSFKAILYAYVFGGITFIPLVVIALVLFTIYTSVPVGDADPNKNVKGLLEEKEQQQPREPEDASSASIPSSELNDIPRTRKGWLTMRRTFEESSFDGGYVTLVRSFLDARSKDPKRSRPKDMWYVVLKGKVLYLYEDEGMTECEAALELGAHDVVIYPEGLLDGELFAKRNAICLKPKSPASPEEKAMPSVTREMKLEGIDVEQKAEEEVGPNASARKKNREKEKLVETERVREVARDEALSRATPWFIFVRSNVEMEDWYFALVHGSDHPANSPTLSSLAPIFRPSDMHHLVATLDEQPDVIPMRWLNALIGRLFFSYYRTHILEAYIIGRLMKKLSKVKRPTFLTDIVVTEVSVGNTAPTFSKPMLKELTKEGDASLEVRLQYKGEIRITVEATATINLGARFKSYTVKLTLAAVLRELEGNLLVKVKRPPSNRIWYAFTQTPKMVLDVEPIVSDRQITWSMILNTIEARLKEIIQESVVMPNMDDIAFFESSQYSHRGGIWPDASRHEHTPTPVPEPTPEDEKEPFPSVSTIDVAFPPVSTASDLEPIEQPPHSQSVEELSKSTPPSQALEAVPVMRSATESDALDIAANTTRARRRTWFSSVSSTKGIDAGATEGNTDGEEQGESEEPRGRTTDTDSTVTPRSQSTPGKPSAAVVESTEPSDAFLSPNSARRSPPRYPETSRKYSSSSSAPSDHFSTDTDTTPNSSVFSDASSTTTTATVPKSPKSTLRGPPGNSTPTSPSSFLSTLKSRAGDKQALSNSAKEAMRKWGVNWGGLKRDIGGSDEMPDVGGPTDARHRVDSQKGRTSYADVRAAVAERKERERAPQGETNLGLGVPSEPIAIPDNDKGKSRSVSTGSPSPPPFSGGISVSPSGSPAKGLSDPGEGALPKFVAPSMSRTTTELHTASSVLPGSKTPEVIEPDSPVVPSTPIHTQPMQARTMTIPGIHASHRGEVMSMGYSAPSPPPAPSENNKMKSPAIQSMYRLWKSPTLAGQQQQETDQSQNLGETGEGNKDVAPLSLSPSSSPAPSKTIPPPLPPRVIDPALSRSRPETPRKTSGNLSSAPSAASEALMSIVSKDQSSRRASQEAVSPTPSRRASTSQETTDDVKSSSSDAGHCDVPETPTLPTVTANTKPTPPQLPPRRIQAPA